MSTETCSCPQSLALEAERASLLAQVEAAREQGRREGLEEAKSEWSEMMAAISPLIPEYVVGTLRAEAFVPDDEIGDTGSCRWCKADLTISGTHFKECAVAIVERLEDEANANYHAFPWQIRALAALPTGELRGADSLPPEAREAAARVMREEYQRRGLGAALPTGGPQADAAAVKASVAKAMARFHAKDAEVKSSRCAPGQCDDDDTVDGVDYCSKCGIYQPKRRRP